MTRSSAVSERGGDGRCRGSADGGGGFCSRCKEARETPRAAQAATGPKSGNGLDGGGHEVLSSLSTVAIGIPNNSETFF